MVAAATAGTDYVDLTGEVPFVRFSIDKAHDLAAGSGARIVHSCGFDSIPSDLTVWALYRKIAADRAGELTDTTFVLQSFRGGVSGGTIDSVRVIADQAKDSQVRRLMLNPQALSSGPGDPPDRNAFGPSDLNIVSARKVDPSLSGTLAPFFMASHNTRIVRRSNALLEGGYGANFHYGETMNVGDIPVVSAVTAGLVGVGTGAFLGAMSFRPTRRLLDQVLPAPGGDRTKDQGQRTFHCRGVHHQHHRPTLPGPLPWPRRSRLQGDRGDARRERPGPGPRPRQAPRPPRGAHPAVAMGDVLTERLNHAGFSIGAVAL